MTDSTETPKITDISLRLLPRVINRGWQIFLKTRPLSVSFSMIFALIGVAILASITRASHAPLVFPVSAGFMLLGPFLLAGFFALADRVAAAESCSVTDIRAGFARTNGGIFAIALVCMAAFFLWVINAAYLYGTIVGRAPEPVFNLLAPSDSVISFFLQSAALGAILAMFVFAISAFSVPLLYYRRATLVSAVSLSVRAVLQNFVPCLCWASILTVAIVVSILIFPLFLVTFPVLAYASHSLYCEIFPAQGVRIGA